MAAPCWMPMPNLASYASSPLSRNPARPHGSLCEPSGVDRRRAVSPYTALPDPSQAVVQTLLQNADQALNIDELSAVALPSPDDVLDSLVSLLPENSEPGSGWGSFEVTTTDFMLGAPLYSALFYSFVNGFAGLEGIPKGAILKALRAERHVSARLFDYVQSSSAVQAKALADNIFRAGVEACDEEAVILILRATLNSVNSIDPNAIICTLDGDGTQYTPIELAAKFQHLGMVKTLLTAKADVNKTYVVSQTQKEGGALEMALQESTVDVKLVQVLLNCHAEIRLDLIESAVLRQMDDVARELFRRLPPAKHHICFEELDLLMQIAGCLHNGLAFEIIEKLCNDCKSRNCTCLTRCQVALEDALGTAVLRKNFELFDLLLPHTIEKGAALCGAIRSGDRTLTDKLLKCGADVSYVWQIEDTTPLAEAIRAQDYKLQNQLKEQGTLNNLENQYGFTYALEAALKYANGDCLQTLLAHSSLRPDLSLLSESLVAAVSADRTDVALIILDALNMQHSGYLSPVLLVALKRRNKIIAEAVLDFCIDLDAHFARAPMDLVAAAVEWGDMSMIEACLSLAAGLDEAKSAALIVAVQLRNRCLTELLIDKYGANPSRRINLTHTPLMAAIRNRDDSMARLLLSKGADPANREAFCWAIQNSTKLLYTLLESFSTMYRDGKKGFGCEVINAAIRHGDIKLLGDLLTARFDDSGFTRLNDREELTAIGFAIMQGKGTNVDVVQRLIDSGISPNGIVDKIHVYGGTVRLETALLVAIKTRSTRMVEMLLENGADLHRPARRGVMRTALQQACEIGSFKMVWFLLERGASVDEPPAPRGGATALQLAAISGSVKIVQLLLEHRASVHAPAAKNGGRTAFEGAAEHGRVTMLRILWDAVGGSGFTKDELKRATSLAEQNGQGACVEYIASLSPVPEFPLLESDLFNNMEGNWLLNSLDEFDL